MNINSNYDKQNFNGWHKFAKDHMALYLTGKVRPLGFQKLVDSIEQNSARYTVECDIGISNLIMFRAEPLAKYKKELKPISVYSRNIKSCLKNMNQKLKKENRKFDGNSETILDTVKTFIEKAKEIKNKIKSLAGNYSKKHTTSERVGKINDIPEVSGKIPPIKPIIIPKSKPVNIPEGKLVPGEPPITVFDKFQAKK